jgi:hypothetical protein
MIAFSIDTYQKRPYTIVQGLFSYVLTTTKGMGEIFHGQTKG